MTIKNLTGITGAKLVGWKKRMVNPTHHTVQEALDSLVRGEMFNHNTPFTIVVTTANTWTKITDGFGIGACNGITFQNNSELKVTQAGIYIVFYNISCDSESPNQEIEGIVLVNDVEQHNTATHQFFGSANDTGNLNGHGILSLNNDDVVSLAINNNTSDGDVVMQHGSVVLIGWPQ